MRKLATVALTLALGASFALACSSSDDATIPDADSGSSGSSGSSGTSGASGSSGSSGSSGTSGSSGAADAGTDAEDASLDAADAKDALAPYTKAEVQALFDLHCKKCHGNSGMLSLTPDFTTGTVGVKAKENMALDYIESGNHAQSYLWQKINGSPGIVDARMPKDGPPYLTAEEIERVGLYIDGL